MLSGDAPECEISDGELHRRVGLKLHAPLEAVGLNPRPPPAPPPRHNAAYWHGAKYLGIGPAAHSFDGEERHWNVGSVERYIAGDPAERELLTNRDRFNEYVMTALRTAEGIDTREVAARFGTKRLERMREEAAPYLQSGALRDAGGRLAVPPERFLISDAVIEALFET